MKRVIGIIASLDTKGEEVIFIKNLLDKFGYSPFIIDIGAGRNSFLKPDIDALYIAKKAGYNWQSPFDVSKSKMIDILKYGIEKAIPELYKKGLFDGLLSIGGLQNTTIAVSAMKVLPIGFPKVIVSTVASGKRSFDSIVGITDTVVIPSLTDFSGSNVITDKVLSNAVAAITGMTERAGKTLQKVPDMLIGMTTMGVVERGSSNLIRTLKRKGFQVVSFHSTGVGGQLLDKLVTQGIIKATIEFSLHEIVGELLGGYSSGVLNRLLASSRKGIPQIVIPGACDFIDYGVEEVSEKMLERKHIYHNSDLVHLKLSRKEIVEVGKIIVERLKESKGPVTVILPLKGMRSGSTKGGALYDPEVDNALFDILKSGLENKAKVIDVNANINDDEFSVIVQNEVKQLLHSNA